MSINGLRKNYSNLTMLQRLALADNAIGRGDEGEASVIREASPRFSYSTTDFSELSEEIFQMRMCNFVVRLGCIMTFDKILSLAQDSELIDNLDNLKNKSKSKRNERISNNLRLAAYLYVRATDSWRAVNSELGLRTNFDEEIGSYLLTFDTLESRDALMRKCAFSEEEARAFLLRSTGSDELVTIAQEIESIREALKIKPD